MFGIKLKNLLRKQDARVEFQKKSDRSGWFSAIMPKTLFMRFILIIMVPTIFSQAIITYIFYHRHWSNVTREMVKSLVGEVAVVVEGRILNQDNNWQHYIESSLFSSTKFTKNAKLAKLQDLEDVNEGLWGLHLALSKRVPYPFTVNFSEDESNIILDIELREGLLNIVASKRRIDNYTTYIFIYWMTGVSTLFFFLSLIFSRNQIRPIIHLARAAEKLGKGQPVHKGKISGAQEVRQAYEMFFKMKDRIERQIKQRTEMLIGVSHDLRTPLTRMKLQLSMTDDPELKDLYSDVLEMEKMLNDYLNFARGVGEEVSELVDFEPYMLILLCDYQRRYPQIKWQEIYIGKIYLKPRAFKRVLINIIENALKFSKNIIVSFEQNANEELLIINIEDDGPGIPDSEKEQVFKPFYRIDQSRNSDMGGVGLGLTIARNMIAEMGGSIAIKDSKRLKGANVQISLHI